MLWDNIEIEEEKIYKPGTYKGKFNYDNEERHVTLIVKDTTPPSINNVKDNEDKLKFTDLKKEFKERKQELEDAIFEADSSKTEKEKKAFLKQKAKDEKKEPNKNEKALKEKIEKAEKEGKFCPEKVFVIEFYGDPKASSQDNFIKRQMKRNT